VTAPSPVASLTPEQWETWASEHVDSEPPLTECQRETLASILGPGRGERMQRAA
jgi:hypothetical protein